MDFIKSLLLYMTMTLAANLEAAPTPGAMPPPTPALVVESVTDPVPTDANGAPIVGSFVVTPGPATPTPLPTMTPNAGYSRLAMGSKGDEVRRLQTRLAELGYLAGNIDGAYGYQTRNAVSLFQEVNGLQKDGVAGPETQTHLFDNPDILPNPAVITPSPEPTATPGQDGLVPVPEDPRSEWSLQKDAQVMFNGEVLHDAGGSDLKVWLRKADAVVSLSDLSLAAGMEMEEHFGNRLSLRFAGYVVTAELMPSVREGREENAGGYVQAYLAAVDGTEVMLDQGDLMYEDGVWYCTGAFLEKTMHGDVVYDAEEKTLMAVIEDKAIYSSVD